MKRNLINIGLLIFAILLLSSCAEIIDIDKCVSVDAKVYGFWNGLWHGLISGITFIGSLFNDDIVIYAFNNNGGWYDFGFLMGVGSTLGGSTTTVHKSRKRRKRNVYLGRTQYINQSF